MFREYLNLNGCSLANENKVKKFVELRDKLNITEFIIVSIFGGWYYPFWLCAGHLKIIS